jgi:hypothetical protein
MRAEDDPWIPFVVPMKESENEVRSEALRLLDEKIKNRNCASYVETAKAITNESCSTLELLFTIWKLVKELKKTFYAKTDEVIIDKYDQLYFTNLVKYTILRPSEVTLSDGLVDDSFCRELLPEKILCEIHGREFSIEELNSIVS